MKHNLILLFLIVYLSLSLAADYWTTPINENEISNISLINNGFASYVFYVPNKVSNQLSLSFQPQTMSSDPGNMIVYFSKFEDMEAALHNGTTPAHCFINKITLCPYIIPENMTRVYFLFQCVIGDCDYRFRLTNFLEIHLNHNQKEHFILEREVEAFNFTVPDKNLFSRMIFAVQSKFQPYSETHPQFLPLYLVESQGSPQLIKLSNHQFLVFNNTDNNLCSKCNMSVTLTCAKGTVLEIEVFVYEQTTKTLELDKDYFDYLTLSKDNEYVLALDGPQLLQNPNFNLLVSINSLSGSHKTLYLNPDQQPLSLDQSLWKSSTLESYYQEEDIMISKSDLDYFRLTGMTYYIAVQGDSQGLYSLHFTVQENKILPLHLGIKQSGLIRNKEMIYYKLQLWRSDEINQGLTLSSTIMSGHIKLYGSSCGQYDDCKLITTEDILNGNVDYKSSDETVSSFKFFPGCHYLYCYYLFAVLGDSSSTNSSKYDLTLDKQNAFINIIENVCYESQINYLELVRIKLNVEQTTTDIESVSFFINTELDYVATRKNAMCDEAIDQLCKMETGNLYNPVIYKGNNLAGEYFLHVFGLKSAEFIIYPEVLRKNQQNVYIKLLEGKIMKYFLSTIKQNAYFEFMIDQTMPSKVEVNIQSNEINTLKMYLIKAPDYPSHDNYDISSSNNFLSFDHSTYGSPITYRLAIETKVFSGSVFRENSVDFSIMYATDRTVKHLESNQPFYDTLVSRGNKKFVFYLDTFNEIVYITRNVIRPYGYSFEWSFSFSKDDGDLASKYILLDNKESTSIKFSRETITRYCDLKHNNQLYGRCPLYVAIENPNYEEIHYVLTARTKEYAIQLKQGKEQSIKWNDEEDSWHFYLSPSSNDNPVDIYISSLKFKFDTYISILNNHDNASSNSWFFPNETINVYKFSQKQRISTLIKVTDLEFCWPKCVILFTLKPQKINKNSENLGENLLHIMVSNGFTEINENKPIQFHTEEKSLKFFKYEMKSILEQNASLLLDLTNLAGISEIYVTVNNDVNEEVYPMTSSYDFFSADGHLALTTESIKSKKKKNDVELTYLYIGIQCLNIICESSLNVRSTFQNIQKISHGIPYDFQTYPRGDALVFEYYHYTDSGFEFKINKDKGIGIMQTVSCFDKKIEDCILNISKASNIHSFSSTVIKMPKNDPQYCLNCIYLIAIVPNNSILSGSFNVVLDKEFLVLPEGQKFYDNLDEEEENLYSCKAPSKEELEVIVNIYHSSPELYISRTQGYNKNKYDYKKTKGAEPIMSLIIEPELDNFNSQIHDEIYIIVYSKSPSNYSITCKSKSSYGILHAGLMEFSEIQPETTQTFLFNSNEANIVDNLPKLSLGYLNEKQFNLLTNIRFRNTKSDAWGDLKDSEFRDVIISENNTIFTYNSEIFILSNQSGIYEMNFINKNPTPVKFSIAIQTGEINMMPYDTLIDIQILPNEWLYYETYIPERGSFVMDLVECVGTLEVFTTTDHEKLMNHEFEDEFKVFQTQSNLKILKAYQGTLYIAIRLLGNSTQNLFGLDENMSKAAYAQLSSHFYENYDDIPQYRLSIPNDGRLDSLIGAEENKIKIMFGSVFCNYDCDKSFLNSISINYTLLVSEKPKMIDSHGKCGLIFYQSFQQSRSEFKIDELFNQKITTEPSPIALSFETSGDYDTYYISVIAKIGGYPNSFTPISFFYKDYEMKKPDVVVKKIIAYGVSVVLGVILVILAFCACYYYGGYKRLLNKLKYEVRDVDNINTVTSLNQSIEMKSTRYEGLIMDEKL